MEEKRKDIGFLVGKPQAKRLDWIHLAQDRDRWRTLVNMVMNFGIPIKYLRILE
jgi:hypothetical protein